MKKKVLLLTITFLAIILLAFSLNSFKVAKADIILSDNFQSGNLNAWTSFSGALAINSQITNNGEPYSVQCTLSTGSGSNIDYQTLPQVTNPIDIREYVYVSTVTTPSTSRRLLSSRRICSRGGPDNGEGELIVTNVGGTLYWGIFYRQATGGANPSGFSRQISTSNLHQLPFELQLAGLV